MLRFELGSAIGVFLQVQAQPQPETALLPYLPATPTKADVKPTIKGLVDGRLALAYPPFDPSTHAAPAQTRAYWLKPGDPVPDTVEAWLASGYPYGVSADAVPVEGADLYTIPLPDGLATGDYLVQTLLGYDDSAA